MTDDDITRRAVMYKGFSWSRYLLLRALKYGITIKHMIGG